MGDQCYLWKKASPISDAMAHYPGYHPGETILPEGYIHEEGALPLPCAIRYLRDVAVPLRDGVNIYVDVFLPAETEGPFPTITNYSPYGKTGTGYQSLKFWRSPPHCLNGAINVDISRLSSLQSFESADPARWCAAGYAVVQPDGRGAFMSEGDIQVWSTQEARDEYDMIEWIAKQSWSNGKVGTQGNSWLGTTQWLVGAEQPPHLAAIAPWEGHTDLLGDLMLRGGIPAFGFVGLLVDGLVGQNMIEDVVAMAKRDQGMNAIWEDKRPRLDKITVPAYVVASFISPLHCRGTFEAYQKISSKEKWLRIHNTEEWTDFYTEKYQQELLKFMDHYLKGENNGWENTPKVRVCVINPGGEDIVDRPENDYPLPDHPANFLYLDLDNMSLCHELPDTESKALYINDRRSRCINITKTFERDTEILGPAKLHLWVSVDGANDMDIYIHLTKIDENGSVLVQRGVGTYDGPFGQLRISRRKLDEKLSSELEPRLSLMTSEFIQPGEIVSADIGFWPTGLLFRKGETMGLKISNYSMKLVKPGEEPVEPNKEDPAKAANVHHFYAGGRFDSFLLVPMKEL